MADSVFTGRLAAVGGEGLMFIIVTEVTPNSFC